MKTYPGNGHSIMTQNGWVNVEDKKPKSNHIVLYTVLLLSLIGLCVLSALPIW